MAYSFLQCLPDIMHIRNPDLLRALGKGVAMFYLQDLAAAAVGVLAAKAANSATSSWTTGITSPVHPRSVQVVFQAGWDGGDVTLVGTDQFGRPVTEVIADVAGTTVQGTKVFKTITSISKESVGATANTMTVQTGTELIGLPVTLLGDWGIGLANGVAELMTWENTYHSFKPTTAPNGTVDFTCLVPVDWELYYRLLAHPMVDV